MLAVTKDSGGVCITLNYAAEENISCKLVTFSTQKG